MYSGLVDVKGMFKCSISCRAKSAAGDWNSSRSGKYCLRSKRKGWGEGSKTIAKTVTSVHELYRSPPPRPSPGPHAQCARILRGNPPAAGAARPAGEGYFGGLPRFGLPAVATRGCLLPPPRPSPTGEGDIGGLSCFGLPYGNPPKVSPAAGFALQGRGDFLQSLHGVVCCPHPHPPPRGRGYFGGLSCFGLPYDNPPKVSTASQGRGRQPA